MNKSSSTCEIISTGLVYHSEWVCTMSLGLWLAARKYRRVLAAGVWIQARENWEDGIQYSGDLKMIPFRSQTKAEGREQIHKTDG